MDDQQHDSYETSPVAALLPIMAMVFVAFLVIGIALPVLPLHVHGGLGRGIFMVGLVTGSQFLASLISRPWAGNYADRRGAKRAVILGLLAASLGGLLYLLSLRFVATPSLSVAILLLGRAFLGAAESAIITGSVSWGLARVAAAHTGRVIAWMGAAMFGAFAIGAPIGSALYDAHGFAAIAIVTALLPVAALLVASRLRRAPPLAAPRASFRRVIGAVWLPGSGSALSTIGFGAMTAFIVLLFAQHGWSRGWLCYTIFAASFILARLLGGHLPDRVGGAKVALFSVLVEAAGQALIWSAASPAPALAGALLTGVGYALVYPGLGIEAVRCVPPQSRGLAMGGYTAFLDLALGFGTPALGLVGSASTLDTVFLVSAAAALGAAVVALRLLQQSSRRRGDRDETSRAFRVARSDDSSHRRASGETGGYADADA